MTDGPQLSVILATYNRRELLRRCLDALAAQSAPLESFEVIVADDGSGDGSAELAERHPSDLRRRVLRLENRGQSKAQREAAAAANGELCLLLDDDVIASPRLVAAHLDGHRRHPGSIGIGALTQRPPARRDWYAETFAASWNAHYADLERRPARWTDCYGGNMSFSRRSLEEIGGIPTAVSSSFDFELALLLDRAGCEPRYLPQADGIHDDQKRWRQMISDTRAQGKAYAVLSRRFPGVDAELLPWRDATSPREMALRRLGLRFRLLPSICVSLGRALRTPRQRTVWQGIIRRTALWQGAREALSDAEWGKVIANRSLAG